MPVPGSNADCFRMHGDPEGDGAWATHWWPFWRAMPLRHKPSEAFGDHAMAKLVPIEIAQPQGIGINGKPIRTGVCKGRTTGRLWWGDWAKRGAGRPITLRMTANIRPFAVVPSNTSRTGKGC